MSATEEQALTDIRAAVANWSVRFDIVRTFSGKDAVQVETRDEQRGRWRKVGPLIFPHEGGSLADTLTLLATMRAEALAVTA